MELKDVILSTLAEMEEPTPKQIQTFEIKETKEIVIDDKEIPTLSTQEIKKDYKDLAVSPSESELMYLSSIRERLLVLFEGFQAPNNTNIEAKMDLTLNFLEYVLATIDDRVEKLERGNK